MYSADHDDRFALAANWEESVVPAYTKREFHCPEAPGGRYGYAMVTARSGEKATEIKEPEKALLTIESAACIPNAHGDESLRPNPGRHRGRNYVGYSDGHAKASPSVR
jgi:hypothetical protein